MNFQNLGHAFDLDETVDDDIRKNYNSNQLVKDTTIDRSQSSKENDLPELPNITKQKTTPKKTDVTTTDTISAPKVQIYHKGNIKVSKGKVFEVRSSNAISDWQGKGAGVTFKTSKAVNGKEYSIPANTTFWGEIIETHQPQVSCNGGLVVIRINGMSYKGQTVPVKGYVIRANDKKIFLNNIKGQRTYVKTVYKKGNWGRSIFSKMLSLTINLGGSGSTILLSPFPLAYGTICLGANTLLSPITAFFNKGGHVSIPAGSNFKIKLLEDIYI